MINDELRYKIIRRLQADPNISQRELAKTLGVSLGKANYCLKALAEKGLIKAVNFHHSRNKKAYTYLLTPTGLEEKARATVRFLRSKIAEYEAIKGEIQQLRGEISRMARQSASKTKIV